MRNGENVINVFMKGIAICVATLQQIALLRHMNEYKQVVAISFSLLGNFLFTINLALSWVLTEHTGNKQQVLSVKPWKQRISKMKTR